jgi:hypothetical protein
MATGSYILRKIADMEGPLTAARSFATAAALPDPASPDLPTEARRLFGAEVEDMTESMSFVHASAAALFQLQHPDNSPSDTVAKEDLLWEKIDRLQVCDIFLSVSLSLSQSLSVCDSLTLTLSRSSSLSL